MNKSFKIRNRASSCSRTSKMNSTISKNPKFLLHKDLAELIELIHICENNKEQVYSVYSPDSSLASNELNSLNLAVAKLKDKIQQQLYENKALKNRYRMIVNAGNSSIKEVPLASEDSETQEMMYRVLRKLNQDASYALDQFKEAIIQSEEDYEEDY